MFVYDDNKRISNLAKHGLDFEDAYLVYDNEEKVTLSSFRNEENRLMDIALVEIMGAIIALVYVLRGKEIRLISLRKASRVERKEYEKAKLN